MTPNLTIHPARVADLARALDVAADDWSIRADRIARTLVDVGEPTLPGSRLAGAAGGLRDLATELRRVVTDVVALETSGLPLGPDLVVSHATHRIDGLTDEAAMAAAARAWLAFQRGDLEAFARINGRLLVDPRYASALAGRMDAPGLAAVLDTYRSAAAAGPTDVEASARGAAIASFLHTLATASRAGRLPLSFAELLRAVTLDPADDPAGRAQAAMLFAPAGIDWGCKVAFDAVRTLVVPANVAVAAGTIGAVALTVPGGATVDARELVLSHAARRPDAASDVVLGTADLTMILGVRCGYLDGGRAAADLMRAATDVDRPGGRAAAQHLFEWLGGADVRPVPAPAVAAGLGAVAVPYLGSFASSHRPDSTAMPADPLPELDPSVARRALHAVASDPFAAADLDRQGAVWVAGQADVVLRAEAGGPPGAGLPTLGDVWGRVSEASAAGIAARAAEADAADVATREWWDNVADLVTVPLGRVPNGAQFAVTLAQGSVVDWLAPSRHELRAAAAATLPDNAARAEVLERLLTARLAASRDAGLVVGDDAARLDGVMAAYLRAQRA